MNLLQSFMGCMYPGGTESIESMDNPDYQYQVANIDEKGNEISRGELQLTDKDLIYFRPSRFPTRWPLGFIRRYGYTKQGSVFIFEAGRRCPSGQAIFAFRIEQGVDLLEKLKEKIDKFPAAGQSTKSFNHSNLHPSYFSRHSSDNLRSSNTIAKRDVSTSTDKRASCTDSPDLSSIDNNDADPRPLSYALIDFDTTRALNESAQAHAASRVR